MKFLKSMDKVKEETQAFSICMEEEEGGDMREAESEGDTNDAEGSRDRRKFIDAQQC